MDYEPYCCHSGFILSELGIIYSVTYAVCSRESRRCTKRSLGCEPSRRTGEGDFNLYSRWLSLNRNGLCVTTTRVLVLTQFLRGGWVVHLPAHCGVTTAHA